MSSEKAEPLGDIGSIYVGDDGTGIIEFTTDLWEMGTGSDFDIIGRSIIIHNMKKLNIRQWSTPLTIGAGIFAATTGLIMFFVAEDPVKFAHELVGIGFSVAIVLHIITNWRPFKRYFSQPIGLGVIVIAWLIGISLVTRSAILSEGDPESLIVDRMEKTSIVLLASVVGMEVTELRNKLGGDGYIVDNPEMSVEQLADKHDAETDDVLFSVFR